MSEKLIDEEIQQKSNDEETNKLNSLKDEEFLKKLNEVSHLQKEIIISDSNLTSNKENSVKFPDFLVKFSSQNKTIFPIDKYLSNQSEDNIFYQHPNLINENENDVFILNSFRELEIDLMNKWFENFEYFDYYLSLYNQELFLNEERKLENIDKLKEKIKINLEKEIKSISNNQTFKFNLILLKFSLKELSNVTLENIDELTTNLNNFENYSKFLNDHFEVSFLLTREINDLIRKVHNLIDHLIELDLKNKETLLGKILVYEYNIVFGLKSLLGILSFIKKINDIDNKGMLSNNIINVLMNKVKIPNLSNLLNEKIEKIQINSEFKSYIKFSSDELNFINSHFIFINKDIAYLLNEKNVLYKFYKTADNKNKYNIIEINNNIITNEKISLITLEKEYLFGFDNNEFGKGENVIKLLHKEHKSSERKTQIKMDEISIKILTKSLINSNEIINNIYLNLLNFEGEEKSQFLESYLPVSDIDSSLIAIGQKSSNLFILHPIYKKQINKNSNNSQNKNNIINQYFFSENYVYALDEYELDLEHQTIKEEVENILYINYKRSYIIRTSLDTFNAFEEEEKNKIKAKYKVDDILNIIKNKNKFIFINNYLCFTDTCQKFFDINKNKICIFDEELNENELIKDMKEKSKDSSIIISYENSIFYLNLIKTTINNVQEILETEYKIKNKFYTNLIFSKKRNRITQIQKIINKIFFNNKSLFNDQKEDILKEIFQTFEEEENISKENNIINEENHLKENISNYILSNLFILTQELNDIDEIENNINKLKSSDESEIFNITKYLKRPFTINIDYPTIKLIEDIVGYNLEKENSDETNINNFCLLFVLDNHLSYMNSLKINSKFLFGSQKNIEILIDLLKKISAKNNEFKDICSSLIIKILSITEDYPVDKITSLFKEILYPVEFMKNEEILYLYIHFFQYANYSKYNMKTIVSNEVSNKFIFDLIDNLLTNEKTINLSSISTFFNEFILFFNNVISYTLTHLNGIKFSSFLNVILSICIKNLSEEKITKPKILQPLLYNLIIQCLNNYKLLPKDFYLQNWSLIYDILYKLQNIRNSDFSKNIKDTNSSSAKDFVLDTFNFYSEFTNNKYKEYFLNKSKSEKQNEEEKENISDKNNKENEINTSSKNEDKDTKINKAIYISLLAINKTQNPYTKNSSTNCVIEMINTNFK